MAVGARSLSVRGPCPPADVLAAFAAGELSADEVQQFAAHLAECRDCVDAIGWLGREEPAEELAPGSIVGRYQILGEVGRGAFGIVHAAYDPELDRRVALKLLHRQSEDAEGRFVAEARAMARVSSPHVLAVHDIGRVDGRLFVAMEFVAGSTLTAWLASEPRRYREILDAFVQAGRGLAAAHGAGIVHRDFKPDNVLVRGDGRVAVTDFGLARELGAEPSLALAGTPLYMPPEALRREAVDARSDLFAFCVAQHEALYGAHPFPATSVKDLLAHMERGPRMPDTPGVPRHVRDAIVLGLSFDPAKRPRTMTALLRELERDPRRTRAIVLALAGVAAAGATTVALWPASHAAVSTCDSDVTNLIAHTWGPPQRLALRQGFERSGHALAADTAPRVERVLDGYAASWKDAWVSACHRRETHRDDELLARRFDCLDRRRDRWRQLVASLEQPDEVAVVNATTATYALPDVEVCADERWLMQAPAPQADARIADARSALARAQVLGDLGHTDAGLAAVAAPLQLALSSGDRALEAEARIVEGDLQRAIDPRGAEKPLHAAVMAASAAGRDDLEAAAKVLLVQTIAHSQLRLADAELAADYAQAIVMRLRQPALVADYSYARALAEWSIGGAERSLAYDIASLAIQLLVHGEDHPKVAEAENNVAVSLVELEAIDASLGLEQSALERRRRLQGEAHPETLNAMGNYAYALAELGRIDEALRLQEQVLAGRIRALGADYFLLDETYVRLARLYQWELGRSDDALKAIERARELDITTFGASSPEGLPSQTHLARILVERGDRAGADRESAAALATAKASLPDTHLIARMAIAARAYVLERSGRCAEVFPLVDDLDQAAREMASGAGDLVLGLTARAHCELARGKRDDAEQMLLRALAVRERSRGPTSPLLADALIELSAFYRRVGRASDAVAAARRAVACREHVPGDVLDRARRELAAAESAAHLVP